MRSIATLCLLLAGSVVHAQFDAIRTLQPEQAQEVRHPIEARIFNSTQEECIAHEAALLEIFKSRETTLEGKQYTCRMLRLCASEACIPVLAPKLTNSELSSFVRLVFQGLESADADKALIAALPRANTSLKSGIIGTLGQRGSENSVKAIAPYLKNMNKEIQSAAITALGHIGGRSASKALYNAKVLPALSVKLKHAQIESAVSLKPDIACTLYGKRLKGHNENIRIAALVALAKANPSLASSNILAGLNAKSTRTRNAATGLLTALPTNVLAEDLAGLKPEHQVRVLGILSSRKATEAETAVLALTASGNESVANAAFQALGNLGGPESIHSLLTASFQVPAAFEALCGLTAEGTDAAIIQTLESSADDKKKSIMIECLAARQAKPALPLFVALAKADWSRTSAAAIAGMANLVEAKDFAAYAELLLTNANIKKSAALEQSIASAAQRQTDANACAQPLINVFAKAEGEAKYAIIRSVGSIGGDIVRKLLTDALASKDPLTRDAALRGLASWPSLDAADQLLEMAASAESEKYRVIALRGYIRLAGTVADPEKNFAMCRAAANATDRPAELKSIIGCIKKNKNEEVLYFLTAQLDNPAVFTEAGWAICEVSTQWELRQSSIPALQRIAKTNDEILANEAKKRIKDFKN